ncbi:MAG TPA: HAD-IA family hydrolase [Thermoguttaceae bacterium]|nr:HAD-IA family hydrolase [Thermoguttaceae bacterium]
MNFRAICFDLDGTLLDTLADIADSANRVLAGHGYPTHPIDAYRNFIGDGLVRLFGRVLPADRRGEEVIAECVAGFRESYAENWNVRTRRYDGVAELLDAATARGLKMAILSNKPDAFTRRCVDAHLSAWDFRAVLGQREGVPPKPDPAGAREIVDRLEVAAEHFLYLGDTPTDMRTARTAGMHPVGVSWGFRPVDELRAAGAARIIARPLELMDLVDGASSS